MTAAMANPAVPQRLPMVGAVSALAWLALLILESIRRAGVFEYPLDDVYIHLAMASGIAGGTYGVNPGEAASASSSILFPLLLLPFPGTEFQRFLPLFWNAVAVAGCGWLWGRGLAMAAMPGAMAVAMAAIGPLALNVSGVGYIGMEHAIHTALAMAGVLGLWLWLTERRLAGWFVAALVVAPLVRYEAAALSLIGAGTLAVTGRPRTGLAIAAAVVLPLVAFSLFLTSLGLSPLPSSVLSKLSSDRAQGGVLDRLWFHAARNVEIPSGWLLVGLTALAALRAALARGASEARLFLFVIAAAGAAHFLGGRVGWLSRYETYATVMLILALTLAWTPAGRRVRLSTGTLLPVLLMASGYCYLLIGWVAYLNNSQAIHLQQGQMARLSQDYAPVPVAVNDLGRVAWNAPAYVLDLWGLAFQPAREMRLRRDAPPGWAGEMADAKGVRFAMVYDSWFGPALGPGWVPVGRLSLPEEAVYSIGDYTVTIYAVDPAYEAELRAAVAAWAEGLPPAAGWEPVP